MLNLEASVTEQKKYLEEVKAWLQVALACRRVMSNEHVLCYAVCSCLRALLKLFNAVGLLRNQVGLLPHGFFTELSACQDISEWCFVL